MTSSYGPPQGRLGHARVAVLTIIKEEFEAARDVLALHQEIAGTQYVTGGGAGDRLYDVVLCEATERTNIPCSNLTADIIDDFKPEVLLLVGIAGGLTDNGKGRDEISLGDVVVAESVEYVEFMKITDGKLSLRRFPVDHPSVHLRRNIVKPLVRSFDLGAAVKVPRPETKTKPKILEGEIVCGDKVMGGQNDQLQALLLKPFEKAIAVDMESIGMARAVCERRTSIWYNPRYLVIRGISDMVTVGENSETRALWKSYAAHAASAVAKAFVGRLLSGPQA